MRVALVVGLVLLAGCSGFGSVADGHDTATPTLSPVPVSEPTTTRTPSPTPEPLIAPGIGPEGVRDPFAVAAVHTNALTDRSFRFTDRLTVRNASGGLRYHRNETVAVDGSEFLITERVAGPRAADVRQPPGTFDLYSDGTQFRGRFVADNETSYTQSDGNSYVHQRERYNPPPYQGRLFALFALPDGWNVTTDPVQLTGTATATNPGPLGPGTAARNLTVGATIAEGLVTEWTVRYESRVDDEPVVVVRHVRYVDVGETTVSRPAWYDESSD